MSQPSGTLEEVDAHEIIVQLQGDPALLAQMRAVLLTEELLVLPELVGRLEQRILESEARLSARLDQLTAALQDLERTVIRITALLETLIGRVEALTDGQTRLEVRLDGMEARLDGMDARSNMDARFDGIDARFDGMDARFDGMDARLDRIEERVERLN